MLCKRAGQRFGNLPLNRGTFRTQPRIFLKDYCLATEFQPLKRAYESPVSTD